ncbi:MAG: hypothetical protein U5K43_04925 [Halofilum sp. (in: g-proteobacteria)]|nr:hypothetical protein [Halofilum sp. (in: g-proteobacteria)]
MRAAVLASPLLLVLALAPAPAASAQDGKAAETRARLEELRERIEEVRSELAAERERHDRASDELARIEQRIGNIAGELADIDARMRATRRSSSGSPHAARSCGRGSSVTGARSRASCGRPTRLGRQPALRLLLRQEEPGAVARALGYYGYLNGARLEAIERARRLITELRGVRRETEAARADLERDRAALAERRRGARGARAERRELLGAPATLDRGQGPAARAHAQATSGRSSSCRASSTGARRHPGRTARGAPVPHPPGGVGLARPRRVGALPVQSAPAGVMQLGAAWSSADRRRPWTCARSIWAGGVRRPAERLRPSC